MRRKVAGEFLHDVYAINAIKIADSDIQAGLRYDAGYVNVFASYYVNK